MADVEEVVGTEIPGEEVPQVNPVEETARQKGWKPESEYDGPEGGFVDANEFLKREPLFDKIKNQSKELKSLKKTIDALVTQHQTQVSAQVELRLRELKTAKKEAISTGDADLVEQIDAEIDQQKQVKAEAPQLPAEISEWVKENPWFKDDKEMNAFAIAHNKTYISNHPDQDLSDSLDATLKAVKKAFPEKFETKPKTPSNPVEGGAVPKDVGGKKGYSVARLSEAQKRVYDQHVKVHKILTHDAFFEGLAEIGELS